MGIPFAIAHTSTVDELDELDELIVGWVKNYSEYTVF